MLNEFEKQSIVFEKPTISISSKEEFIDFIDNNQKSDILRDLLKEIVEPFTEDWAIIVKVICLRKEFNNAVSFGYVLKSIRLGLNTFVSSFDKESLKIYKSIVNY